MDIEVKVPGFPESVADGSIVTWHKQPGDAIKRDEVIVDIETDKVLFEVPAPQDGVLKDIVEAEGSTVVSGQLLAHIESVADSSSQPEINSDDNQPIQAPENVTPGQQSSGDKPKQIIAPAARKLIAENTLDEQLIVGTGKDGRILKEDVLHFISQAPHANKNTDAPLNIDSTPSANSTPSPASPLTLPLSGRTEKRVPMTRLRARIAERLLEAQQNAAILTTFNEVNMQPVMDLRQRYKDKFEKEHGVRLGFMSFFVKAAVEALKRFPMVNASIDGSDIVYHGFFDVGIAVGSPRGLVVPILRDVDQMNLATSEKTIREFSEKATKGSLSIEDMTGGTFTITNGGVFGSMLSTPILNPPQSAILGMHNIQERVMVENGEMVIRPMMYLALSYDHRIIDGREAVQFLVTIKNLLEDPALILLDI